MTSLTGSNFFSRARPQRAKAGTEVFARQGIFPGAPRVHSRQGFTFFEVMVTVVILMTGIVMIYKAFLVCLDQGDYLSRRLYAINLLEHKIASLKEKFKERGDFPLGSQREEIRVGINNKPVIFEFNARSRTIDFLDQLCQVDAELSWAEKGRIIRLGRSTYLAKP